jgi:hypothetical protein
LTDNDAEQLAKVQIENSIALGWKEKDILLYTNFKWEYGTFKSTVLENVEFFDRKPQASKTNALVNLFQNGMIKKDELYWFHDLDAFQLEPIHPDEVLIQSDEIALTDFGGAKYFGGEGRWNTGVIFFKSDSADIFRKMKEVYYEKQIDEEEALGLLVISNPEIRKKVIKLNNTYNFTGYNFHSLYENSTKPIKIAHFHPNGWDKRLRTRKSLDFFVGENPLHAPLIPEKLIKTFKFHRITPTHKNTETKTPNPVTIYKTTPLCKIAFKHGADKCPQITHEYTPIYYKLLQHKRKEIKKVLEIGVGTNETMGHVRRTKGFYKPGASLYMWREFFPNAQIYGADIDDRSVFKDERIQTYLCDQSKSNNLIHLIQNTGFDLDLVIDDGSHRYEDQVSTCLTLMPLLKKDVVYVIEDVIHSRRLVKALKQYNCWVPPLTKKVRNYQLVIVTKT